MPKPEFISGNVDCSPEDVNYEASVLDRFDEFLADLITQDKLQGASYLLSRHGKIFAWKAAGRLKFDSPDRALKPDSIRWIASVTKTFTAMAIMKLVEDGKLYLYKNVSAVIKEFDTEQHRKINIEHLLTHTAGGVKPDEGAMAEAYPLPFFSFNEDEWEDSDEHKHKIFRYFLSGPKINDPGKEWAYSTAGYTILAEIITRVSGMPYHDFIRTRILEPLGMDRTFFEIPERLHPETCTVEGEWGSDLTFKSVERFQFLSGGGGLKSSLHDLWKYGQMCLNRGTFNGKRIIGEHTLKTMTFNRLKNVPGVCWGQNIKEITAGLGFAFDNKGLQSQETYGHEGAGRCRLLIDPKEDFIAIWFVPTAIEWLPESIQTPPQILWSGLN